MLTYRTTSRVTAILAVLALTVILFYPPAGLLLILLALIGLVLFVAGSLRISSGFYLKAFCKLKTTEKRIALTFDDGPDESITPKVLDILKRHQIRAVFFLIGRKAEAHPAIVRDIVTDGHAVGIHSYGHSPWFDFYSRKKMERDLLRAEEVFKNITGEKPFLFRPPYGVTNPALAAAVKNRGYLVAGWSVRSFDTTFSEAEKVVKRVIRGLHPGAVILLHDTLDITPAVVEQVIELAGKKGYRFENLKDWIHHD